jgi:general nucleoside transport system ATP-binding protein
VNVSLQGIRKAFPETTALHGASFDARLGEVHALLGENGAGKTTLMNILAGLYQPDEGSIWLDGQHRQWRSPSQAIAAGIGMVHQHFKLVTPFTVYENLLLGVRGPLWLDRRHEAGRVRALTQRYPLAVDPLAPVWQLSMGERQRVELLRLLWRGARVLILDEPTSVLTPQESQILFDVLRSLAGSGHTVIFISHKLEEVRRAADRITVMRAGRAVAVLPAREASAEDLAALMVGREVVPPRASPAAPGAQMLVLDRLAVPGDRRALAVRDVTLTVRAGEIVGIAGVAGNGQRELAEALAGLRPIASGSLTVGGRPVGRAGVRQRIEAGLALIPEDRLHTGLVGEMTAADNLILKSYRQAPLSRRGVLNHRAIRHRAQGALRRFALAVPPHAPVRQLSGGTMQRLLLARELDEGPRVIVAMSPARGLDVGATAAVHGALLEARERGVATLLISEDLDELMALADRLAVMHDGRISAVLERQEFDRPRIGLLMAGGAA